MKNKQNQPNVETIPPIDQQEIVDFKRNHTELDLYKYGHIKIEPNVITYNDKVYVAIDSSNPTIEEIKQEWEEAGFEIRACTKKRFEIYKHWIEEVNGYEFDTEAEITIVENYLYITGNFPNKYRQLLIKTLMALGKEV